MAAENARSPLTDDRGRPAGLLNWEELDDSQVVLRKQVEVVVADPTADARSLGPGFAGCLVKSVAAAAVVYALYELTLWAGVPAPAAGWGLVVLLGVGAVVRQPINSAVDRVVRRFIGRNRAAEIARRALEHGVCPSCGYALAGIEAQADGCVQCPECGAAWRAARITTRA